jgi:NADH-quinone oxidoreductase subunit D
MVDIGIISQEDASVYGLLGPMLRATGVKRDLRKDEPYMVYERLDFDVPVGTKGDNFDRFAVRFEEMPSPFASSSRRCVSARGPGVDRGSAPSCAAKQDVYGNIEGLMAHFKLVIEGIKVPAGEVYFAAGGNGEVGFFIASDGERSALPCACGRRALRHVALAHMVKGTRCGPRRDLRHGQHDRRRV